MAQQYKKNVKHKKTESNYSKISWYNRGEKEISKNIFNL